MTMPISDEQSSVLLFDRYRGNQYAIGQWVETAIRGLWGSLIDPEHFNDSWHRLEPFIVGIVDTYHGASAADAAQYYSMSRAVAGFYGAGVPGIMVSDDYFPHVVNIMGAGQFFHFLGGGNDAPTASAMALDALAGSAVRLVMNGGRNTVTRAASYDPNSLGWERIMESGVKPCNYCSMLAGSNVVSKSLDAKFHAHDRCQCLARSVFAGQQSANDGIRAEWKSVTSGKSGKSAEAAWNQYWSEKDVGSEGGGSAEPPQEQAGNAPVAAEPE
jgi:hypothetical protein